VHPKQVRQLSKSKYAGETLTGFNPGEDKVNQDYITLVEFDSEAGSVCLWIVADGHGPNGHFVARFCCEKICEQMKKVAAGYRSPIDEKQIADSIAEQFDVVDEQLKASNLDVENSGATLTFAMILQGHLFFANIGDSKAVLVSNKRGSLSVVASTALHHPEEVRERARISECGGIVTPHRLRNGDFDGPMRVWKPDYSGPGLAVARAFGDLEGKQVGVICTPGSPV